MAVADCELNPITSKKKTRPVHIFSKANWEELKSKASEFKDSFLNSSGNDVEQMWSSLKSFMNDILNTIPSNLPSNRRHVPWMHRSIKRLCRRKQHLYKKAKKDRKDSSWSKYRTCKCDCIRQLCQARSGYISDIIGSAFEDNDSKPFRKFIKSCKNGSPGVAPLKSQGVLHSYSATKAELLNAQFKSVLTKEDLASIPELDGHKYPSIENIIIAVDRVEKLLKTETSRTCLC